jgi:predicted flap endonuclease-1-like 5' DNA nuclease
MDVLIANWPLALVAALVAIVLLYFLLRPRQRVALTDSAPVRPHMAVQSRTSFGHKGAGEGRGLSDEAAAAAADITGSIISARVHDSLPGASGPPDDLVKLKGIGPKLAAMLNSQGLTRFDQIAKLSPAQVESLDESLGAFRGRLARDHVVAQADYLARGDIDGFEHRFGKL